MESHEIKIEKTQSLSVREKVLKEWKTHKNNFGFARDACENLEFLWKKNNLNCTIPSLTLVSTTERGM